MTTSVSVAVKYLKRYPFLTAVILFSVIMASVFEGASLGMVIPFIQSMTGSGTTMLGKIPFLNNFMGPFSSFNKFTSISVVLALLFMIIVIKNVFAYFSNLLMAKLKLKMARDTNVGLMNNVIEYDLGFFDNAKTGHIISNMSNETKRMGDFISQAAHFLAIMARIVAFTALLFLISVKASLALVLLIAIVMFPLEAIMKRVKRLGGGVSQAMLDMTQKLTDILNGIRLIKSNATEETEKKAYESAADNLFRSQFDINKYIHLLIPLSEICIFGIIVICFEAAMHIFKIDIFSAFPFIATYLLVLVRTLTQLNALNGVRSDALSNLAAFKNYEEMNDSRGKRTIMSGSRNLREFNVLIEFKNVEFSYSASKKVLKSITTVIPKGKITALVGLSGAGKSTFVNLIPRFYDVTSGEILVDGVNIKDIMLHEWRRKIGVVSQDAFIFNANVKYNISYGHPGKGDEQIIGAARTANAHEFIMALPQGYDTILGERGVKLSGGQKQRLTIARAIIHNPEILILDEATSSLDTETERLITSAIDRLTENRTVVAIAHRLSTILHADKIIVLQEGQIAEEGDHLSLLKAGGLYKRLYDGQFTMLKGKADALEAIQKGSEQ